MSALLDALKPFAAMAEYFDRKADSHIVTAGVDRTDVFHCLNVGHLRKAREVVRRLESTPDPVEGDWDCPPPGWNGLEPIGWEARQ